MEYDKLGRPAPKPGDVIIHGDTSFMAVPAAILEEVDDHMCMDTCGHKCCLFAGDEDCFVDCEKHNISLNRVDDIIGETE